LPASRASSETSLRGRCETISREGTPSVHGSRVERIERCPPTFGGVNEQVAVGLLDLQNTRPGHAGDLERSDAGGDPMVRPRAEIRDHAPRFAITAIRVVVELEHGDFAKLDALSRGDCAREFLRLLALQAIETHAVLMPRVRQRDGSLRPKAY